MNATEKARQKRISAMQGYDVRPFSPMTDAHAAHVEHWLTANEKVPADVKWSLYPIGMVQRWIERAESVESQVRAAELAAYEECCKAVCKGCCEGLACLSHPHQNGDHLDHDRDGFLLRCAATDIRSLPRFQELQKSKS
jgi:hypothetical protein